MSQFEQALAVDELAKRSDYSTTELEEDKDNHGSEERGNLSVEFSDANSLEKNQTQVEGWYFSAVVEIIIIIFHHFLLASGETYSFQIKMMKKGSTWKTPYQYNK